MSTIWFSNSSEAVTSKSTSTRSPSLIGMSGWSDVGLSNGGSPRRCFRANTICGCSFFRVDAGKDSVAPMALFETVWASAARVVRDGCWAERRCGNANKQTMRLNRMVIGVCTVRPKFPDVTTRPDYTTATVAKPYRILLVRQGEFSRGLRHQTDAIEAIGQAGGARVIGRNDRAGTGDVCDDCRPVGNGQVVIVLGVIRPVGGSCETDDDVGAIRDDRSDAQRAAGVGRVGASEELL